MCRSLAEGGRRCPHQGYSSGRENQAARQQLSRARRRLEIVEAKGGDVIAAKARVAAAQARVETTKPAVAAPAVEQTPTGGALARIEASGVGGATLEDLKTVLASGEFGDNDVALRVQGMQSLRDAVEEEIYVREQEERARALFTDAADQDPDPQTDAAAALERVRAAGGLAYASDEDLTLASRVGNDYRERESFHDELRIRAGRRVREAAAAAAEADRSLGEDRYNEVQDAINANGAQIPVGDWMRMSELRDALPPDMSRAEVDATLKRLSKAGQIHLSPDPDRKNLEQSDHENAIHLGGEDNHLIVWDRTANTSVPSDQQVETSIRDAYRAVLADRDDPRAEYVDLADLRGRLPKDFDRATVDRVLDKMIESPDVALHHELVQRSLTPERRDAAVVIGGEPRHLIALAGGRAARLAEATSREEAADLLRGLTKKELAQVAATHNLQLPSRMRKADQLDWLYQSIQDGQLAQGVRPASSAGHTNDVQAGDRITDVVARFDQATTREAAAETLNGLTKKELAQVAAAHDQELPSRMRKADQIDWLYRNTIGARQDHEAIRSGSWRSPASTKPGDQPDSAVSKTTAGEPVTPPKKPVDSQKRSTGKQQKDAGARPQKTKPAVERVSGLPVSGQPSDKPLLENTWGTGKDTPVSYHDDGPIGMAVKYMGADQRMSVDGEPLANVLGKLATDVNRRRRTPQEGLDAMKQLRDRLPDGSRARQCLDSAVQQIDAPRGPAPVVPDGTPEPLRKLVHNLHDIPVVRAQPDREMEPLLQIINDVVAGKGRPMMVEMEIDRLRDRRHESYVDSGWRQIRDAVAVARDEYQAHVREQSRRQT